MRDRTVTISSASKTFSVTGWKAGYVLAAPDLTDALRRVHQFVTFCSAAPLQEAVAIAIEDAETNSYYAAPTDDYASRRDKLMGTLERGRASSRSSHRAHSLSCPTSRGWASRTMWQFARFMAAKWAWPAYRLPHSTRLAGGYHARPLVLCEARRHPGGSRRAAA